MTPSRETHQRPALPKIVVIQPETRTSSEDDQQVTPTQDSAQHTGTASAQSNLIGDLPTRPRHSRKRSSSVAQLSGSETETEKTMSSKVAKQGSGAHSPGSSKKSHCKGKGKALKTDDWSDVTEPEERRRIQNRIAQRKFREKARENKEKSERDAQNQEQAGRTYHIPSAFDMEDEADYDSGLPWGGISMRHVVARGHEAESRRSSSRGEYIRDEARNSLSPYSSVPYSAGSYRQPPSWGSSGGGDGNDMPFDEDHQAQYYYGMDYELDQSGAPRAPQPQPRIVQSPVILVDPALAGVPAPIGQAFDASCPQDSSSPSCSSVSSYGYVRGHW